MPILQPRMKRIQLVVPATPEFAAIRDLDGTLTQVASPRDHYRFRAADSSYDFASTGRTVEDGGGYAEVFTAVGVRRSNPVPTEH